MGVHHKTSSSAGHLNERGRDVQLGEMSLTHGVVDSINRIGSNTIIYLIHVEESILSSYAAQRLVI